ncbi:hypothetical protein ACHAPJ_012943 [Fusarium lateritium]
MSNNTDDHKPAEEQEDDSTTTIPIPSRRTHTFLQSAVEIGRLKQDTPLITDNSSSTTISQVKDSIACLTISQAKDSIAYLMVKREGDSTGFLLCDADGKAVDKSNIENTLTVSYAKIILIERYNKLETEFEKEYREALLDACARRRRVQVAQFGQSTPYTDEHRFAAHYKRPVYCSNSDPELNYDSREGYCESA